MSNNSSSSGSESSSESGKDSMHASSKAGAGKQKRVGGVKPASASSISLSKQSDVAISVQKVESSQSSQQNLNKPDSPESPQSHESKGTPESLHALPGDLTIETPIHNKELSPRSQKEETKMAVRPGTQTQSAYSRRNLPMAQSKMSHSSARRRKALSPENPRPAELLFKKADLFEGGFNTMAVFETLPSMYTKDKWDELQKKRRCELGFNNLFWLALADPKAQDGHHLEAIINRKVNASKDSVMDLVLPIQTNLQHINMKQVAHETSMIGFRNEVANISNLRLQMHEAVDEHTNLKSQTQSMEARLTEVCNKVSNMTLNYARRISEQEKRINFLDEFVHRPNTFLETMKRETEKIDKRLSKKMQELLLDVEEKTIMRDDLIKELEQELNRLKEYQRQSSDRLDQSYLKHAQMDRKFEFFEKVVSEFNINIEALKTHCLSTDLHLESTLPLQIASIAYEVGLGTTMKKQYPKYRANFQKRIRRLEKNYQDCSDPFLESHKSLFKKNQYELPEEYINPTKVALLGSGDHDSGASGGESPPPRRGEASPRRNRIPTNKPSSRRASGDNPAIEKTLNDLQNESNAKRSSRLNIANSLQGGSPQATVNQELPKTIPGQLLTTLQRWQPVSSKWTIGKLFEQVTGSVTDFLKIPMYELNSEEFYSLYNDVDNQEIGHFKPLPKKEEQEEEEELLLGPEPQLQLSGAGDDRLPPKSALKKPMDPINASSEQPKSALKKPKVRLQNSTSELSSGSPIRVSTSNLKLTSSLKLPSSKDNDSSGPKVTIQETPVVSLIPRISITSDASPLITEARTPPKTFGRLRQMTSFGDPRLQKQQAKLEKAEHLQQQAERRKLQESVNTAIDHVISKIDFVEQTFDIRNKRSEDTISEQAKKIKALQKDLHEERQRNEEREAAKAREIKSVEQKMEATRKKMKKLVGELEHSVNDRIKIPQLQLLHTEYQRLKEIEAKNVESLLARKAEIKALAQAQGGRLPKDDGKGLEIRKKLTACRMKLRIVQKKIKKFGELGKIPMGASMKIYHEDSESEVSSSSLEEDDVSMSSFGESSDSAKDKQRAQQKKVKPKNEVLATGLVYQPKFKPVVKASAADLSFSLDELKKDTDSAGSLKSDLQKSKPPSAFSRQSKQRQQSPGNQTHNMDIDDKISEVESVSDSDKSPMQKNASFKKANTLITLEKMDAESLKKKRGDDQLLIKPVPMDPLDQDINERQIWPKKKKSPERNASMMLHGLKKSGTNLIEIKSPQGGTPGKKAPRGRAASSVSVLNLSSLQPPMIQAVDSGLELDPSNGQVFSGQLSSGGNQSAMQRAQNREIKDKHELQKVINFGSNKVANSMIRSFKNSTRKKELCDAEAQTDECLLADIQIGLTDYEEEQHERALNAIKVEKGTDAPSFVILNVIPGDPDRDLIKPVSSPHRKYFKAKEGDTRIQSIVHELKDSNERQGLQSKAGDAERIIERFAVIKGKDQKEDILKIQQQTKENAKTYIAYKENQQLNNFKQALDQLNEKDVLKTRQEASELNPDHLSAQRREIRDDKSAMTRKSRRATKSRITHKKSRMHMDDDGKSMVSRKSRVRKKQPVLDEGENKSLGGKSQGVKSKGGQSRQNRSKMNKIDQMNENLDKSVNDSFIDSSFNASLSDDDDDSDEDDLVTFQEFVEFKQQQEAKVSECRKICDKAAKDNMTLLRKIDNVDWDNIEATEDKVAQILGDFQLTVDGLISTIEADMKRWRNQMVSLESKYEAITIQQRNVLSVSEILKQELFAHEDDNWTVQENIIKFLQIQVALAQADEVDKQGIRLVGQKAVPDATRCLSEHKNGNQPISLDPNCKSCQCKTTVERTTLMQNFKLACLVYNPSPVFLPSISTSKIDRTAVVEIQEKISQDLAMTSNYRKQRISEFQKELSRLDERLRENILKMPFDPLRIEPRFVQSSDQKTMDPLNYLGIHQDGGSLTGRASPRKSTANLNITITNNNTNYMLSPSGSPVASAKYGGIVDDGAKEDPGTATMVMQVSQSHNATSLRKPILQGKIDSRAVLGLKKTLNTASNFSQILQSHQQSQRHVVKQQNTSSVGNRLSHKSMANLNLRQTNYRPGDAHYKITKSSLEPFDGNEVVTGQSAALIQPHVGASQTLTKPQTAESHGSNQSRSLTRRNFKSISRQSTSPKKLKLVQPSSKLEAIDKTQGAPLTSRNQKSRTINAQGSSRKASKDHSVEELLPQLSKRGNQVWAAAANSSDDDARKSINILTGSRSCRVGYAAADNDHDAMQMQNPLVHDELNRSSAGKIRHEGEEQSAGEAGSKVGAQIKIEVRNSTIFGGPQQDGRQMTDQEIRAVRRNVVSSRSSRPNRTAQTANSGDKAFK